jgi:acyl-coenzyme A synthetase/AMP-(fatty) acid ligase
LIVVGTNDEPAADGAGELLVASVTMMDRYWARPDLTSAAIVERSFPDHVATRWYRTGDLVETDASGDLVFLGRSDNQVKIRGQRIELEAIDNTIRELDAVEEVAVVVVADEAGERVIVAMVQYSPGATLSTRELQRHVGTRHPRVAIPAELVAVARLPRTGTGKVDRNAALERIGDRKER